MRALAFCESSEGRLLTIDPRLKNIHFTGGTAAAKAIMAATRTELISECSAPLAAHGAAVDRALDDLAYGDIAVSTVSPDVWRNPALTGGQRGEAGVRLGPGQFRQPAGL